MSESEHEPDWRSARAELHIDQGDRDQRTAQPDLFEEGRAKRSPGTVSKVLIGLLLAVVLLAAVPAAWDWGERHRHLLFPRFSSGDCYVTILENNVPLDSVRKVLGRAPSGDYLLIYVGRQEAVRIDTLSEADFRSDETKFRLRFVRVSCP